MTGEIDSIPEAGLGGYKLEHSIIGRMRGQFHIPGYQRGYRWTKDDVKRLLDDLWEIQETSEILSVGCRRMTPSSCA